MLVSVIMKMLVSTCHNLFSITHKGPQIYYLVSLEGVYNPVYKHNQVGLVPITLVLVYL